MASTTAIKSARRNLSIIMPFTVGAVAGSCRTNIARKPSTSLRHVLCKVVRKQGKARTDLHDPIATARVREFAAFESSIAATSPTLLQGAAGVYRRWKTAAMRSLVPAHYLGTQSRLATIRPTWLRIRLVHRQHGLKPKGLAAMPDLDGAYSEFRAQRVQLRSTCFSLVCTNSPLKYTCFANHL